MAGEFRTVDGEDRFYLPAQSSKYAVVNSLIQSWRVENKVLKIGGNSTSTTTLAATAWFNNNDDNNQCFVDKESLLAHHHQMRLEYITNGIANERYYVQPRSSTPAQKSAANWAGLSGDLWITRLEELINEFGIETRLELSLTPTAEGGAFSMDGAHLALKGTHCAGPSFERWFFLHNYLIPGITRPYLVKDGFEFTLKFDISPDYLPIQRQIIPVVETVSNFPRNWLWYGAPGTGKSYTLKEKATYLVVNQFTDFFPFSFSPATTYGEFVGENRPKMIYRNNNETYVDIKNASLSPTRPGTPAVEYTYVSGIFLRALFRAYQIETPVVLMIDEINRGDIYEILGEVFQLMERDADNVGSSEMALTPEAMNWLNISLMENRISGRENIAGLREICEELERDPDEDDEVRDVDDTSGDEQKVIATDKMKSMILETIQKDKIRLPPNLFIWATLNPNDTSVQQIDSAFFRRWVSRYISIDFSESGNSLADLRLLPYPMDGSWENFRQTLNKYLLEVPGIDEEDLIGRWFLKNAEFNSWERFYSKLVFHLANHVLKMSLNQNYIFSKTSVRAIMRDCEKGKSPFIGKFDVFKSSVPRFETLSLSEQRDELDNTAQELEQGADALQLDATAAREIADQAGSTDEQQAAADEAESAATDARNQAVEARTRSDTMNAAFEEQQREEANTNAEELEQDADALQLDATAAREIADQAGSTDEQQAAADEAESAATDARNQAVEARTRSDTMNAAFEEQQREEAADDIVNAEE